MAGNSKVKDRTLAEQLACMKSKYPQFDAKFISHSSIKVEGTLQPTARSHVYAFVLKYDLTGIPKMRIISPELRMNYKGEKIPHLYPSGNLCLYMPKYREFTKADFLADKIVPWTSLWLYYYELWHATGEWLGGGEHPK
ncbi:hypothetical protein JHJ32_08245 [Parapedobacter sp. ISTM3]|uniref:hypothetical protein n=1 Tax=Parapedobacter sp. ISTM3 TaxID=2800130 RepID=UPI001907000C|nr:hypothetical protein [Parapedobacter sp. ISTM3]MBK1439971.1 hypothetical protein [Parapedobacter sp. ISTM3]